MSPNGTVVSVSVPFLAWGVATLNSNVACLPGKAVSQPTRGMAV